VSDVHVAVLTPPGVAAIAVLAVGGPDAWPLVRDLFHPPLSTPPPPGSFRLGRFGDSITDQVVLSIRRLDPVPWLELHCHGGREVVRMLLDGLQGGGARLCSWTQLESNATDDPLRALAAEALSQARTVRTASILLDQYHGAFRGAALAVQSALDRGDTETASRLLSDLARWTGVGRHLLRPFRVVVAGAPNVGKSSLINALVGYQRSVVAPTPGTTRDVVTATVAIDGWPVELADTAGMRTEAEALESEGIRLAEATVRAADLCLWMLDASREPSPSQVPDARLQVVINKIDLPAAWELQRISGALHVSAVTGAGLAELTQAISRRLVPEVPPAGAAVPFTPGLCERIDKASLDAKAGRWDTVPAILASARTWSP
jgi:tRNA modification GTPase